MDSHHLCGGYLTPDRCLKLNTVTGTWDESLTLDVNRAFHVSWTPDPDIGTFLMGGAHWGGVSWDRENVNSTTLIKPDGSQEPGFSLKYNTEYEFDDIRELKFSFVYFVKRCMCF